MTAPVPVPAPAHLNEHQQFERDWWGDCANTFSEEVKQLTYAEHMGLQNQPDEYAAHWPRYDLQHKSVLDLGGGPTSMLLKAVNVTRPTVVDPCPYPEWTRLRYAAAGIALYQTPAEHFGSQHAPRYDEVWIYNVLQHVEDPRLVVHTARRLATTLRIFDWVNTPPSLGHPHTLTKQRLDEWIGAPPLAHVDALPDGTVSYVSSNGAVGFAYHGVFELAPPYEESGVSDTVET